MCQLATWLMWVKARCWGRMHRWLRHTGGTVKSWGCAELLRWVPCLALQLCCKRPVSHMPVASDRSGSAGWDLARVLLSMLYSLGCHRLQIAPLVVVLSGTTHGGQFRRQLMPVSGAGMQHPGKEVPWLREESCVGPAIRWCCGYRTDQALEPTAGQIILQGPVWLTWQLGCYGCQLQWAMCLRHLCQLL